MSNETRGFKHQCHRIMSREIPRDQGVTGPLGSMRAEEGLAVFLLNLCRRFMARGYSPSEFYLRMTREGIGSFLGLKLETISRIFSKFQEEKVDIRPAQAHMDSRHGRPPKGSQPGRRKSHIIGASATMRRQYL